MKIQVLRKVPFKLAKNRLVWGVVLLERHGLALLFFQSPDQHFPHSLVVAQENSAANYFEDASANRFPIGKNDLAEVGGALEALGEGISDAEFRRFFKSHDDWNCD